MGRIARWLMRSRGAALVLALLLVFGGIAPTAGAAAPGDESPPRTDSPIKHPRLESSLAAAAQAPRPAGAEGAPLRVVIDMADDVVADGTRAAIIALGGSIEAEYKGLIQASVSPAALESVAALPGVTWVAPPAVGVPDAVTGEGVVASNASVWQTASQTGSGVKVAIIDNGFTGYAAKQTSGDLPASLTTADYCSGNFATATNHGTAVAEIVHEMAPDAQLYLICAGTAVQLGQAVNYAIAQGVNVINHSVSWFATSRGDGSGGANTPEGIAATARAAGILWVSSAGNYAQNHWSGTYSDTDSNGVHNYTPTDNGNTFFLAAGARVCVYLKWDAWPTTDQDYDLYIGRSSDGATMASSVIEQSGTQAPAELACYTNNGAAANFYASIARYSATAMPLLDLFMVGGGPIEHVVAAGSLSEIASSPASFTAAAICWQDNSLEYYSSRGPTIDGRTKPDIAGQDSISSATYGNFSTCGNSGFTGTSAAAPMVAGAAALVKGANPTFTPAQLQSFLEGRALDLGTTGKDSSFGAGRLWLGTASESTHTLTIPASAGGDVAVSPPGSSFDVGTVVTLTATADSTHRLTGWVVDGAYRGWAASLTITMNDAHTVQATFAATKLFSADVPSSHPNYTAITELASRGYIFGLNAQEYGPGQGVQRAQMAALIARATPLGPGTPTNGTLTPPGCVSAGTWDCENWGNEFSDQSGVPASLWRAVGTLKHYGVAFGYDGAACAARGVASPCYAPTAPVSYVETVTFITRAMVAKGYWVMQPNAPQPYAGVPGVFTTPVATYVYYTGGVPAPPSNWNAGANRGWFAAALWAALNSYWGTDGTLPDGRPAGGNVP